MPQTTTTSVTLDPMGRSFLSRERLKSHCQLPVVVCDQHHAGGDFHNYQGEVVGEFALAEKILRIFFEGKSQFIGVLGLAQLQRFFPQPIQAIHIGTLARASVSPSV